MNEISEVATRKSQIQNLFYGDPESRKKALEYIHKQFMVKILMKLNKPLPPNTSMEDTINDLFIELEKKYTPEFLKKREDGTVRMDLNDIGNKNRFFRKFLIQEMTWFIGKLWRTYYSKENHLSLDAPTSDNQNVLDLIVDKGVNNREKLQQAMDEVHECRKVVHNIFEHVRQGKRKLAAFEYYYLPLLDGEKNTYTKVANKLGISTTQTHHYISEVSKWFHWVYKLRQSIDGRYAKIIYNGVLHDLQEELPKREWNQFQQTLTGQSQEANNAGSQLFFSKLREAIAKESNELTIDEVDDEVEHITRTLKELSRKEAKVGKKEGEIIQKKA